jgi:hypothetical protein
MLGMGMDAGRDFSPCRRGFIFLDPTGAQGGAAKGRNVLPRSKLRRTANADLLDQPISSQHKSVIHFRFGRG